MPPVAPAADARAIQLGGSSYDYKIFPHVIPSSQLQVLTLPVAPDGTCLEFTFNNRNSNGVTAMMHEGLAWTLINLARVIPDGVVVCFTSYAQEQGFVDYMSSGHPPLLDALLQQKRLFREQDTRRSSHAQHAGGAPHKSVDELLQDYKRWIEQCRKAKKSSEGANAASGSGGALLFCVMGGSLSEGINFSDHLARAVIVVGIPYPRPHDLVWKLTSAAAVGAGGAAGEQQVTLGDALRSEIARYLDPSSSAVAASSLSRSAATSLLHATAMRAVNQSAGRCIRHIRDFATVILVDARYGRPLGDGGGGCLASRFLSRWMVPSLHLCANFCECLRLTRDFFSVNSD